MGLSRQALWVCLVGVLFSGVAAAEEPAPQRLVRIFGPEEFSEGTEQRTFLAPSTAGKWFLTVEREYATWLHAERATIRLNGKVVLSTKSFKAVGRKLIRVEVAVQATNVLEVRFSPPKKKKWKGKKKGKKNDKKPKPERVLTITLDGVVPEAALPTPLPGQRVGFLTLFSQDFKRKHWRKSHHQAGAKWHHCKKDKHGQCVDVPVPTTEGLFSLRLDSSRRTLALVHWNGDRLFFPLASLFWHRRRELTAPVGVESENVLCVRVLVVLTELIATGKP